MTAGADALLRAAWLAEWPDAPRVGQSFEAWMTSRKRAASGGPQPSKPGPLADWGAVQDRIDHDRDAAQ